MREVVVVEGERVPSQVGEIREPRRRAPAGSARIGRRDRSRGVFGDEVDEALRRPQLGIDEEWVQVAVQAGRLEVPVDSQHPLPVARQQPGDVGEHH